MAKLKSSTTPVPRVCKCLICQYQWVTTLVGRLPVACPGCRSPYWNIQEEFRPSKRT